MQDYSYIAIASFLPHHLAVQISALSRNYASRFNSWYILDPIKFPPHVTVWIAYVPTKNLPHIRHEAREVISKFASFNIRITSKHVNDGGYVTIKVYKSKVLQELHNMLLRKLNKWREGYLHPKYTQNLNSYPQEQRESLKRYGTRFAGVLFEPHITVAVIETKHLSEARKILPYIRESYQARDLVLFRQVEKGESIEILDRFPLRTTPLE